MKNSEVGILIARVVLGIIFLVHGIDKFQSGLGNIAGWFENIGLPGFLAYVVAIIEAVGGLAMILGLGTRIVGILFTVVMFGAILTVKFPGGLLGDGTLAGYELDLILLAVSLQMAISGSRVFALDGFLTRAKDTAI